MVLRFREALAVVLGSRRCAYIPFFPFSFHAICISLFLLSHCLLRLWVLISIVPWFCISAIMQFTVLLVFGFVLSCFRGALAGVSRSYNFVSVPNKKCLVTCEQVARTRKPLMSAIESCLNFTGESALRELGWTK